MTLVELMIALGILGFVLLVCYSSSIALQRGFGYSSAWTEARINQVRVLDSLAVDLRNATTIAPFPPSTLPITYSTLPITLTVPKRYSEYYRNTGDPSVKSNFAAGDPTWAASPIAAPLPSPGQFLNLKGSNINYGTNTIAVQYALSSDGTTITRKVVWTGGPAGGASRDVAIFPNRATVTFRASGPTTLVTSVRTSPDYLRPNNPSFLEDTVFLREYSMNPAPTPTPTPSP
jgi:hypothetical protein